MTETAAPPLRVLFIEHKEIWGGGQVALLDLINAALARPEDGIEPLLVYSPGAALGARVQTLPIRFMALNLGRIQKSANPAIWAWNISQRFGPTWRLARLIRSYQIDVIYANGAYSYLASVPAAKITRTPIVWAEHNSTLPRGTILRAMIHSADHIITVADVIRQQFVELVPASAAKITTVHNGVEIEPDDRTSERLPVLRSALGLDERTRVVGTVGRLSEEKGQDLLVQAATALCARVPDAKFLLVGDGPTRPALENLAARVGVGSRVIFTGFRRDVADLLQLMDVFVLPSRAEGFPLALLEAMAQAKAVVAADVGGIKEAITNGQNGFLFQPGDWKTMAQLTERLLCNPDERRWLGERARERIQSDLTFAETWRKSASIIHAVMRERKRTAESRCEIY